MPWKVYKENDRYCVHKMSGDQMGEQVACHDSEAAAMEQMQALYANEPGAKAAIAVKFADGADDLIEGPGIPFGGPWGKGSDIYGEHFTAKTDFAFDLFPPDGRPLMYHHGLDKDAGISAVGRVKGYEVKPDIGVWTKAQLDKNNEYFGALKDLIKAGKLFFSSGAMPHLTKIDRRSGEILRWPWMELSLTPIPANIMATVDFATASRHFKSAGLELPAVVATSGFYQVEGSATTGDGITTTNVTTDTYIYVPLKAEMDADARNRLDDSDFAYIDSQGGRHLPMNDAAHARNALARFNQTHFESDEAKQKAHRKLLARCRELGVEVSEEGAKAAPSFVELVSFLLDESPGLDTEPVPIGLHAEATQALAASLLERTKDLQDRRLKEGRILSDSHRQRLTQDVSALRAAAEGLQTILDSSAPPPESTRDRTASVAALRRMRAQLVALRVKAMTVS